MFDRPGIGALIAIIGFGESLAELVEWAGKEYQSVTFTYNGEVDKDVAFRASVLCHAITYMGNGPTPWSALCAAIGREIQAGR